MFMVQRMMGSASLSQRQTPTCRLSLCAHTLIIFVQTPSVCVSSFVLQTFLSKCSITSESESCEVVRDDLGAQGFSVCQFS